MSACVLFGGFPKLFNCFCALFDQFQALCPRGGLLHGTVLSYEVRGRTGVWCAFCDLVSSLSAISSGIRSLAPERLLLGGCRLPGLPAFVLGAQALFVGGSRLAGPQLDWLPAPKRERGLWERHPPRDQAIIAACGVVFPYDRWNLLRAIRRCPEHLQQSLLVRHSGR